MTKHSKNWHVLSCLAILLAPFLLLSGGRADDQIGGTAGTLNVSAKIEPFMSVSVILTDNTAQSGKPRGIIGNPGQIGPGDAAGQIEFSALEKPGIIDGDKQVLVVVSSNITGWSVTCTSQGLSSSDGSIPGDRIYVKSDYTNLALDSGAGPGYESLAAPKLIASGAAAHEVSHQASFKLKVTWEDKPGSYDGVLTLTVLPVP